MFEEWIDKWLCRPAAVVFPRPGLVKNMQPIIGHMANKAAMGYWPRSAVGPGQWQVRVWAYLLAGALEALAWLPTEVQRGASRCIFSRHYWR